MGSLKQHIKANATTRLLFGTLYRMLRAMLQDLAFGARYPFEALRASRAWWHYANREGIRRWREHPLALDAPQRRIVSELNAGGLALTHLDELFPNASPLNNLVSFAQQLLDAAQLGRKKHFLKYLWGGDRKPTISLENPFIRVAIHDRVLAVVHAYLGMYAKLDFFSANVTIPGGRDAAAAGSQRWHRDPGDIRIIKMFVYLNDVDAETGPFTYVRESNAGNRFAGLYPAGPRNGMYPPPGAVERAVPSGMTFPCLGSAGTVIFCDTKGLHKGGYSISRARLMSTFGYSAQHSPTHPITYRFPEGFAAAAKTLSPAARFAVGQE
ncbi:MAG: hypothetical protein U1A16_01650 [Patescibacteria group bacterium]|nr:hypothetical protein [Patescibacteria group bacterium]